MTSEREARAGVSDDAMLTPRDESCRDGEYFFRGDDNSQVAQG